MLECLAVGAGGFIGAVCRYLMGLIPYEGDFPLITLIINFVGGIVIGAIAGFSQNVFPLPDKLSLFLKTGICGGFTTFSTFSLETYNLIFGGKKLMGLAYAGLSIVLCVAGVWMGISAVRFLGFKAAE